jgi:hypothetical protein
MRIGVSAGTIESKGHLMEGTIESKGHMMEGMGNDSTARERSLVELRLEKQFCVNWIWRLSHGCIQFYKFLLIDYC